MILFSRYESAFTFDERIFPKKLKTYVPIIRFHGYWINLIKERLIQKILILWFCVAVCVVQHIKTNKTISTVKATKLPAWQQGGEQNQTEAVKWLLLEFLSTKSVAEVTIRWAWYTFINLLWTITTTTRRKRKSIWGYYSSPHDPSLQGWQGVMFGLPMYFG